MHGMFWYALTFNQCINNWDVSKVTDLGMTFYNARAFNKCLASWEGLTENEGVVMDFLFEDSGCESTSISDGIWCNSNCSLPVVANSSAPTNPPTTSPTKTHSLLPTDLPIVETTTSSPTTNPTVTHSLVPTNSPTTNPTVTHSLVPTNSPTPGPTFTPHTESPTFFSTYMVETWSNIVLLEKEGDTDFPKKGLSIIEQSPSKVTVAFKQAFTASNRTIQSVYYQYQVDTFDRKCFEKQNVPGEDTTSITIQCYKSSPMALLEVWIADKLENNVLSKDCNATIPNCCHPTIPEETPVSKFLFEIKCVSAFDEGSVV